MLYDKSEVIQALKDNDGIMCRAADDIGCARQTIAEYCKQDDDIRAARDEAKDVLVDRAETELQKLMFEADNERVKMKSLIFFLSTQGKDRGYIKRLENHVSANIEEALNAVFPQPTDAEMNGDFPELPENGNE